MHVNTYLYEYNILVCAFMLPVYIYIYIHTHTHTKHIHTHLGISADEHASTHTDDACIGSSWNVKKCVCHHKMHVVVRRTCTCICAWLAKWFIYTIYACMTLRGGVTMHCTHAIWPLSTCMCMSRDLSGNQVTALPEGLFQGLTSLQMLWVAACGWWHTILVGHVCHGRQCVRIVQDARTSSGCMYILWIMCLKCSERDQVDARLCVGIYPCLWTAGMCVYVCVCVYVYILI